MFLDPNETAIAPKDTLVDKASKRHWKVKRPHPKYPNSWVIKHGEITRLIFPIDQSDYQIYLAN